MKGRKQRALIIPSAIMSFVLASLMLAFLNKYVHACVGLTAVQLQFEPCLSLINFIIYPLVTLTLAFVLYALIVFVYTFAKKNKFQYSFSIILLILSLIGLFTFFLYSWSKLNILFPWLSFFTYLTLFLFSLFYLWKE